MPKFFHHRQNKKRPAAYRSKGELVDPIGYNGDLDLVKYPILPGANNTKKIEEEIENPLNRR